MNRKVARNGFLVAAMGAIVMTLPSQRAKADYPDCTTAECQQCLAEVYAAWQGCQYACHQAMWGITPSGVVDYYMSWCDSYMYCNQHYANAMNCYYYG